MKPANDDNSFAPIARLKVHEQAIMRLTRGIAAHPEAARGLSKCLANITQHAEELRARISGGQR